MKFLFEVILLLSLGTLAGLYGTLILLGLVTVWVVCIVFCAWNKIPNVDLGGVIRIGAIWFAGCLLLPMWITALIVNDWGVPFLYVWHIFIK
jgi:hypothetical protein